MTNRGSHFDNKDVRAWCKGRGVDLHIVAAYSPWVNGLNEGTNSKILGHLKCWCVLELGEGRWEKIMLSEDLPQNWPDHLDAAISNLNNHILPALHYSPNEILTGNIVNTARTPIAEAIKELTVANRCRQTPGIHATAVAGCLGTHSGTHGREEGYTVRSKAVTVKDATVAGKPNGGRLYCGNDARFHCHCIKCLMQQSQQVAVTVHALPCNSPFSHTLAVKKSVLGWLSIPPGSIVVPASKPYCSPN